MATTLSDLGIDRLSVDERLDLAQAIWESAAPPVAGDVDAELDRRLADLDARPGGSGDTWDGIKEFVRRGR